MPALLYTHVEAHTNHTMRCHSPSLARPSRAVPHQRHDARPQHLTRTCCRASPARVPRITDFIAAECPIRGIDGTFREQPWRPGGAGGELVDSVALQVSEKALLVPGQRQLVYVAQQQLERVIAEEGRLTLAPMAGGGSIDDSGTAATAATAAAAAAPRLSAPKRGSWAVAGMALGVQRLPDHRALLRLLVTDRVAVQALSCPSPGLVLARAGVLRDRWAYMVRQGALQEHLAPAAGRTNGSSSSGQQAAGREVLTAVQQVQDAASELMQLLAQLAGSVSAAADAPGAGEGAGLAGKLVTHEAADELDHLATWCSAGAAASGDQDGSMVLPADGLLLERAWRLSFAPYAATGLAAVLSAPDVSGVARAAEVQEVLELTDLGQRLEAAAGAAQVLRQQLAARLSLETL